MPHKGKGAKNFRPIISIIIPVFNQAMHTVACIKSIRANTPTPFEIIWVDNGSSVEEYAVTRFAMTRPRMRTKLVRFEHNSGFVSAINAGLREAEGKFIILLNNDTEVTYRWEKKLLKPLLGDPKVGAVGPVTQSRIAWQEASHLNRRWDLNLPIFKDDINEYAKLLDGTFAGKYVETDKVPLSFFCVALRRETFDKVGLLDPDFGIGLADDDDYCFRLRAHGYKLMLSLGTFVFHHHRTTFKAAKIDIDGLRRRNIKILRAKKKEIMAEINKQ